jgi:hypothetical protein
MVIVRWPEPLAMAGLDKEKFMICGICQKKKKNLNCNRATGLPYGNLIHLPLLLR